MPNTPEEEVSYEYDVEDYQEYIPVKQRAKSQISTSNDANQSLEPQKPQDLSQPKDEKPKSLVELVQEMRRQKGLPEKSREELGLPMTSPKQHESNRQTSKPIPPSVKYQKSLPSSWKPPRFIDRMSRKRIEAARSRLNLKVEGEDALPPIESWTDMKIPPELLQHLKAIAPHPTPIQSQAIPVALSGRDLIAIAPTGSGKAYCFALPVVLYCLEQELTLEFTPGEGPLAIILSPTRELSRQTHDVIMEVCKVTAQAGMGRLRSMLATGGTSIQDQAIDLHVPIHIICATPGRMYDLLYRQMVRLENCRYLVLDEADKLLDVEFNQLIRNILPFFQFQRQTVVVSANCPRHVQDFTSQQLVKPITVTLNRSGSANKTIVQEVEHVAQEDKLFKCLDSLQKTAPPVIVFADHKKDIDEIQEYFLVKGVDAVSVHAAKSQQDRDRAIRDFKTGKADVLVASDIISKGLNFDVRHVINYDMPHEIEDYTHRIGRTRHLATTFVNNAVPKPLLLDLKYLLQEAGQKLPGFLDVLVDRKKPNAPCPLCSGLGHDATRCPKANKGGKYNIDSLSHGDW